MSEFLAVVTTIGQQKIAAAIGGVALAPTVIRVGDGNGAPITPVEAMTDLVRRVGVAYPIISAGRDPANANAWRFEALIPEADGPFDIREIGLFDAAGDMLAIAKHPYVEKRSTAQGALMSLVTQIIVPVSETAQITLNIQTDAGVSIFQQLRAGFMVVESATVANPPINPALGASYLVPAAPTGAWAGLTGRVVQWNGNVWVSVLPPVGHVLVVQDQAVDAPARWQRREAGGWVSAFASATAAGVTLLATKAKVAGRTDNASAVTPLGLAGVVGAGIDFRTVINASTSAPPANPALFDSYLIAANPAPTGAWAGHAGKIATWDGGEWIIEQLRLGARVIDRSKPVTEPDREQRQLAARTWTPVQATSTDFGHSRRATAAEITNASPVNAYVGPADVLALARIDPAASTLFAPKLRLLEARQSADLLVATSVDVVIPYATVTHNTFVTSTWNGTTFVVGAGEAGYVFFVAATNWFLPANTFCGIRLWKNNQIVGEIDAGYSGPAGAGIIQQSLMPIRVAVGDQLTARAYHQAGSSQWAYRDTVADRTRLSIILFSSY